MNSSSELASIETAILRILDGPSLHQAEGLARLLSQHPEHQEWIDRMVRAKGQTLDSLDARADAQTIPAHRPAPSREQASSGVDEWVLPPDERFEEGDLLAVGGMGLIRRVLDRDLRRTIVKKTVRLPGGPHPNTGDATTQRPDRTTLKRFLEEARVTGQLGHPNIVPVHDVGIDAAGDLYFTMPEVRGRTLEEVFQFVREKREDWNLSRVLEVILKACDALDYAHAKGVTHRDIKPANIMIGRFGEVYVMDWGLALVSGRAPMPPAGGAKPDPESEGPEHSQRLVAASSMGTGIAGTLHYMAPEQAIEGEEVDGRVDIYAIGAMLYQLLTGRPPYADVEGTGLDILKAIRRGAPRPLTKLDPEAPPELLAITTKAMARNREERYSNIRALADDLRNLIENRVVKAYRTGPIPELMMWVRRNRPLAIALASIVLLLAIALAISTALLQRAMRGERNLAIKVNEVEQEKAQALLSAANLAMQRGRWAESLEAFATALPDLPEETFHINTSRVVALHALSRTDESARLLRSITAKDSPEQRAKLQLLRGDLLYDRSSDYDAGTGEIRAALESGHLSKADTSYASAILAPDAPSMRKHLEQALRIDPTHRLANESYAGVLLCTFDNERLEKHATRMQSAYPDDPLPKLAMLLSLALRGETTAHEIAELTQDMTAKTREQLEGIARISKFASSAYDSALDAIISDVHNPLLRNMLSPTGKGQRDLKRILSFLGSTDLKSLPVRLPPAFMRVIDASLMTFGLTREQLIKEKITLQDLLQISMRLMPTLSNAAKMKPVWEHLMAFDPEHVELRIIYHHLAIDDPHDVQASAIRKTLSLARKERNRDIATLLMILNHGSWLIAAGNRGDTDLRESLSADLRPYLERAAMIEGLGANQYDGIIATALIAEHFDLALVALARRRSAHPDRQAPALDAETFAENGFPEAALRTAEPLLDQPEYGRLREAIKKAHQQLHEIRVARSRSAAMKTWNKLNPLQRLKIHW